MQLGGERFEVPAELARPGVGVLAGDREASVKPVGPKEGGRFDQQIVSFSGMQPAAREDAQRLAPRRGSVRGRSAEDVEVDAHRRDIDWWQICAEFTLHFFQ